MSFEHKINWPMPGKYVVAVSGGVDSIALLHLLAKKDEYELVVAHVDHGWRHDAAEDHKLVEDSTKRLKLPFEATKLNLENKSEASARTARYDFLEKVQKKHAAQAIITAHHWDDRQETSLFNLLRGTNRQGLAPLKSTEKILRPLLNVRKADIIAYANQQKLSWREDTTNVDTAYSRNFIRRELLPFARKHTPEFDKQFADMLAEADRLNQQIDSQLEGLLVHGQADRQISVPSSLTAELSLPVLRHLLLAMARKIDPAAEIDRLALEQAALQLKTGRLKKARSLNNQLNLQVGNDRVTIALIQAF